MATRKRASAAGAVATVEIEATPKKAACDLLSEVVTETAKAQHLPQANLELQLVAERLCCGVWEKVSSMKVAAVESGGKLMFLTPIRLPDNWHRLKITCDKR